MRALDGVTIGFDRTTFTAVMGPSGSGKSTLLQCAAGLDRPDAGRVVVDGFELGPLGEKALTELRRDRIGFIFQAFNLLGALTAEQNVGLPLRLAGRRPRAAAVRAALTQVGLGERGGHLPSQMSGGQQQRVAIARALITRPNRSPSKWAQIPSSRRTRAAPDSSPVCPYSRSAGNRRSTAAS
ncbi:hypothetical protein GCM10022284_26960 [Streptomyces hundungensis]